jgi:prepilin-type N-terminal cleavage/methylation domain-containing protein
MICADLEGGKLSKQSILSSPTVQRGARVSGKPSEAGYSLIEILAVIAILGVMSGMAATIMTNVIPMVHADSSLDLLVAELRQARQMSVDQRRNFVAQFKGTNEFVLVREELNGTTTPIADYFLSNNITYTLVAGVPDTPDQFGNSLAVNFAGGNEIVFVSDGTVTDTNNNVVNGTVFLGTANNPATARAVTIMGATGRIHGYQYNGSAWH